MFSTLSEAPSFLFLQSHPPTMALPHPYCLLIFPDTSPTNTLFITQMASLVLIELPSKTTPFWTLWEKKVSTQPVSHFFLTHCKHSPNPYSASQCHFLAAIPLLPHQVPSSWSSQLSPAVFQAPLPQQMTCWDSQESLFPLYILVGHPVKL